MAIANFAIRSWMEYLTQLLRVTDIPCEDASFLQTTNTAATYGSGCLNIRAVLLCEWSAAELSPSPSTY